MADKNNSSYVDKAKFDVILQRFNEIWPKYVPYCGVFGYFTLSTNALHLPIVQQLLTRDASRAFTNGCFALSHVGTAVYIYHRPSFILHPTKERLLYSLFGSTMFNLGSILSWSVLQVGLPKDELGKSLVGLACSLTYLYIGYRYLKSADKSVLRAFNAGKKKLVEDESDEVKERLERSHHEYEDQEVELDLGDEMWNRQGSLAEEQLTINVNDKDT